MSKNTFRHKIIYMWRLETIVGSQPTSHKIISEPRSVKINCQNVQKHPAPCNPRK